MPGTGAFRVSSRIISPRSEAGCYIGIRREGMRCEGLVADAGAKGRAVLLWLYATGFGGLLLKGRVLVTGGAGFIGSRLVCRLLDEGQEITIFDNLSPQIHGNGATLKPELAARVRFVRADVRDENAWKDALDGVEVVVHLAAETGTGQSMYRTRHYADVNISGTSTLVEVLLTGKYPVRTLVVASSRAVYGEGAYTCNEHGIVYPEARTISEMKTGQFDPRCPLCNHPAAMVPTAEDAPLRPMSFYALTKQVQEQIALMYADTLGMNAFILRYQNVFGPGQSLKNPYTGILAIFSNRARVNQPIYLFEDGKESRDFVYVDDVVEATMRCISAPPQRPIALNVGTGRAISVSTVVDHIIQYFGSASQVTINGAFRIGDIRHNCADVTRLRASLDYIPTTTFEEGIQRFLTWAEAQTPEEQSYENSLREIRQMGLMHE